MARIFIDVTDEERHWDGVTGVTLREHDGLSGHDMALAIGDVEVVLSISQAITLFDVLDAWVNAGPAREIGAVHGRVLTALKECMKDHGLKVSAAGEARSHEGFAHMIEEYMKLHGLRFRMTGDDERENLMARRARRARAHADVRKPGGPTPDRANKEVS